MDKRFEDNTFIIGTTLHYFFDAACRWLLLTALPLGMLLCTLTTNQGPCLKGNRGNAKA